MYGVYAGNEDDEPMETRRKKMSVKDGRRPSACRKSCVRLATEKYVVSSVIRRRRVLYRTATLVRLSLWRICVVAFRETGTNDRDLRSDSSVTLCASVLSAAWLVGHVSNVVREVTGNSYFSAIFVDAWHLGWFLCQNMHCIWIPASPTVLICSVSSVNVMSYILSS